MLLDFLSDLLLRLRWRILAIGFLGRSELDALRRMAFPSGEVDHARVGLSFSFDASGNGVVALAFGRAVSWTIAAKGRRSARASAVEKKGCLLVNLRSDMARKGWWRKEHVLGGLLVGFGPGEGFESGD